MNFQIEAKDYGAYDVVVCGGGTAGAFAAIAAGRQGAKTLLVERSFTVGGMLTMGNAGITKFSEHCTDVNKYKNEVLDLLGTENSKKVQVVGGLALEYVERMVREGTALGTNGTAGSYIFTDKCEAQWTLMDMLEDAGVEVLYDTRVCMAVMDGDTLKGIVVHNKEGFCRIEAGVIIDCTGDADVAAVSGAPFHKGASELDVQECPKLHLGQMMHAGCMYRVRDVDFDKLFDYLEKNPEKYGVHPFGVMDIQNAKESHLRGEMCVFHVRIDDPEGKSPFRNVQVYNLPTSGEAILLGPLCGVFGFDGLDARSISKGQRLLQEGARKLTAILKADVPGFENVKVTYVPDAGTRESRHIIGEYTLQTMDVAKGVDFEDSVACGGHPIDISPRPKELDDVPENHWRFHIPYRTMVPLKVENLLVAGRSISATRLANGAARPTAQCMALGEAAGIAAAMCVKEGVTPRNIDVQKLRAVLVENGAVI